jgi:hypothetical protein
MTNQYLWCKHDSNQHQRSRTRPCTILSYGHYSLFFFLPTPPISSLPLPPHPSLSLSLSSLHIFTHSLLSHSLIHQTKLFKTKHNSLSLWLPTLFQYPTKATSANIPLTQYTLKNPSSFSQHHTHISLSLKEYHSIFHSSTSTLKHTNFISLNSTSYTDPISSIYLFHIHLSKVLIFFKWASLYLSTNFNLVAYCKKNSLLQKKP